jgi:TetR/AcrR family transcriptional regulator, ethionamide resistance regulator
VAQTKIRQTREANRQRIVSAAAELVRERSFATLTVEEVMATAGIGRTLFYRHFDDLGDLILRAGREAVDEIFAAQEVLARSREGFGADSIRDSLEAAVAVYQRHGPVLRAVAEAAADDERVAAGQDRIRRRFDQLVAAALLDATATDPGRIADADETARALNVMNENYLLDAFGREPRVSAETALRTLTEVWVAVIGG